MVAAVVLVVLALLAADDAERALREAFAKTMKDPAFIKAAAERNMELSPSSGEEVELPDEAATVARLRARLAARGDAWREAFEGPQSGRLRVAVNQDMAKPDTALRDITHLLQLGMLEKSPGGGRSTGYRLSGH